MEPIIQELEKHFKPQALYEAVFGHIHVPNMVFQIDLGAPPRKDDIIKFITSRYRIIGDNTRTFTLETYGDIYVELQSPPQIVSKTYFYSQEIKGKNGLDCKVSVITIQPVSKRKLKQKRLNARYDIIQHKQVVIRPSTMKPGDEIIIEDNTIQNSFNLRLYSRRPQKLLELVDKILMSYP